MNAPVKSPRAFAHYRRLVEEANATPLKLHTTTDLTDAELWWSHLTPLESWVFSIDPSLHSALLFAHIRYQDMIGCTDLEFEPFREEDREAFPAHFYGDCVYSFEAAVGFMVAACQMPFDQSLMWVCRASVQNVRSGLYELDREPPDWARGPVDPSGLYADPGSLVQANARGAL